MNIGEVLLQNFVRQAAARDIGLLAHGFTRRL
jgi:hypothetical protein